MRTFLYDQKWKKLLTPEIVGLLTRIHEYKGEQTLYIDAKEESLTKLVGVARIRSTEASNKIEGIYTSDARLKAIVKDKTTPRTRNEREIAGYRDVLNTINESYDYISIRPNMILQLHRDLYKFEGYDFGGKYKTTDNIIGEEDEKNRFVRFKPVSTLETPESIENLCNEFDKALGTGTVDPLLLIPMFVLDFLCIHPFNSGNGRMSRLLTLLMLYRAGYFVGKYISIEHLIEKTKESYYECLQDSSLNWHEGDNDYGPFVKYMLSVLLAAYRDLSGRVKILVTSGLSKTERVSELIRNTHGEITKSQIMEKCPDISRITVERALSELLSSENIIKICSGRYTKYVWNRDKE
ncbi:MAG: Fic family protein [Lachnospiraceae bacterium]|nr:Fic family protein [Lachnospiraceae bacterium]